MALHESLRELMMAQGARVTDDADQFRGALDDFLSEDEATTGELNVLVDAVRLGALRRFVDRIDHGAEPVAAVREAGESLARDRGTDNSTRSCWAIAALGFALGAVDESLVTSYGAAVRALEVPPPPHPTPPSEVPPGPESRHSEELPVPALVSEETAQPQPPNLDRTPPATEEDDRSGRGRTWLVALIVLIAIAGSVAAGAGLLGSEEDPSTEPTSADTSDSATSDAPSPSTATRTPTKNPSPTPNRSPTPSTPTNTTTPVDIRVDPMIPEDFPLDLALSERPIRSADTKVVGPDPDAPGIDTFQPICGENWLAVDPADQLAYSVVALLQEGAERRELRTYPTADAAVDELSNIRAALDVCTEETAAGGETIRWWEFPDADTGYEDSVTFGFTYTDGLGGYLFTLTRVGLGILAVQYSAEYSVDTMRSDVDRQVNLVRALTDDMCVFTEDGC